MATVTSTKRIVEVSIALEMNALEAALVLGLMGTAAEHPETPTEVRQARAAVTSALTRGLDERMAPDWSVRVLRDALVGPISVVQRQEWQRRGW